MHNEPWSLPALPSLPTIAMVVATFVLACTAVYGTSLENDFVRFDDGLLIVENPIARGITPNNVAKAFTTYDPELYVPLTIVSYQLDYMIGGTSPFIYHAHSLALHVINAILVAWLAFLLSASRRVGMLSGLLWALHPLHVEAVSWAAALKDVQSTTFFLSSLIAYVYGRSGDRTLLYWASITLFTLGLLSKVVVIALPVVLLLLEWREKGRVSSNTLVRILPFVALAIVFGCIAVFGKIDVLASSTPWETLLMALKSTVFTLGKLAWPWDLSVLYPYEGSVSIFAPAFFVPALTLGVIFAAVTLAAQRSRDVPFAFAFFLVTLVPTFTNFSKLDSLFITSDRYAYIPSIGLAFLVALGIDHALSLPGRHAFMRTKTTVIWSVTCIVLAVLASLARTQSLSWNDTESLFRGVLRLYPSSFIAHNNLGNFYLRQGKTDDAIREFEAGLVDREHARLLNNLGRAYGKKGLVDTAEKHFRRSLELEPSNAETYVQFGRMFADNARSAEAYEAYDTAIALQPTLAAAYLNRGALFLDEGHLDEAAKDFNDAALYDPALAHARYNLGIIYAKRGNPDEAIEAYEAAIALQPSFFEARFNLAMLYAKKGMLLEARDQLVAAKKLRPSNTSLDRAIRQIDDALSAAKDDR